MSKIRTTLLGTPLAFLMKLSVEIQWPWAPYNPHTRTAPTWDHLHAKIVPSSFDIAFPLPVIDLCPKEYYHQGSERSSGPWWQSSVWRKADSTQTTMSVWSWGRRWPHFIYTRRLIYLPTASAWLMHSSHLVAHTITELWKASAPHESLSASP